MSDKKFVNGLVVKAPHERAPDFVVCKISIKCQELIEFLQQQEGEWLNADVKVSRNGKWYAEVNDWKPQPVNQPVEQSDQATPGFDDDIPF